MTVRSPGASTLLNRGTLAKLSSLPACCQCRQHRHVPGGVLQASRAAAFSNCVSRRRRSQSSWAAAASAAATAAATTTTSATTSAVHAERQPAANAASSATITGQSSGMGMDALRALGKEMKFLTRDIRQLVGSGHPVLDTVAKYYTQSEGKRIRPQIVLLMARATSLSANRTRPPPRPAGTGGGFDDPLSPLNVLCDSNPFTLFMSSSPAGDGAAAARARVGEETAEAEEDDDGTDGHAKDGSRVLLSQRRLAEITELIHSATLLHDDVIDQADVRRSVPSANMAFGNKMAVLAGDFMLGRASVALARLRDARVTELMATVIANLVEGEFMQLQNYALDNAHDSDGSSSSSSSSRRSEQEGPSSTSSSPMWTEDALAFYLRKTYLKSASLISKSCRGAALLGHCSAEVVEAAYGYGKNLGMAFQLVDDMLDYTVSADELGKPAGADLELGLATAPLLFAWKERRELGSLIARRFQEEGDVQLARELVLQSDGVEQTRALAQQYADKAVECLKDIPCSSAKDGLVEVCLQTMNRRK